MTNQPIAPQPKKKKDVFRILFLCMVAFGFLTGIAFPPVQKFYFNDSTPISISFAVMCMMAGIIVGVANYILFSLVISKELRFLVTGMNRINDRIRGTSFNKKQFHESYEIEVRTNDILGEVTQAFNTMGKTVINRLDHEAGFREIISLLSANVDLDVTAHNIVQYYITSTCISAALLYGKIDDEMVLLASHAMDTPENLPQKLEDWQGAVQDTVQSGIIHTIDTKKDMLDWVTISTPLGTLRPSLVRLIPLQVEKSTVGLVIAACGKSDFTLKAQLETLETYSKYMAPYLQNALLHNKIQEMASYDALTHVLNRRFGLIRLKEEFSTAQRYSSDLSVIMLDIDNFKQINDTYGHEAGDFILKQISSIIALNLRNEEVICRYGGEEFLIILPRTNLNKSGKAAERLRQLVQQLVSYYKESSILVTISLGVASLSSISTQNKNNLVNAADTALYYAKNKGRNRVALFRDNESVLLANEDAKSSAKE